MDVEKALEVLGLSGEFTAIEVKDAKRNLLKALHPDNHPGDQAAIFTRLTREVVEAAEFLNNQSEPKENQFKPMDFENIEDILFNDDELQQALQEIVEENSSLVVFDRKYTAGSSLAIGIRGINYSHYLQTFSDDEQPSVKSALFIVVFNQTSQSVTCFCPGPISYLIDDRGYQYSPSDSSFYWVGEDGNYNIHNDFIAPKSRIDGILLFPPLRPRSKYFCRYIINGVFQTGEDYVEHLLEVDLT